MTSIYMGMMPPVFDMGCFHLYSVSNVRRGLVVESLINAGVVTK